MAISTARLVVKEVGSLGADLQNTQDEYTTQSELLGSGEIQSPYEWHGQDEKCRIGNDVRDGVSIEELVDVDATGEAARRRRRWRKSRPKCAHGLALEDCNEDLGKGLKH